MHKTNGYNERVKKLFTIWVERVFFVDIWRKKKNNWKNMHSISHFLLYCCVDKQKIIITCLIGRSLHTCIRSPRTLNVHAIFSSRLLRFLSWTWVEHYLIRARANKLCQQNSNYGKYYTRTAVNHNSCLLQTTNKLVLVLLQFETINKI